MQRLIKDAYVGSVPIIDLEVLSNSMMETLHIPATGENRCDYLRKHLPPLLDNGLVIVLGVQSDEDMETIKKAGENDNIMLYDIGHADAVETDILGFIINDITRITHVNDATFLDAVGRVLTQ